MFSLKSNRYYVVIRLWVTCELYKCEMKSQFKCIFIMFKLNRIFFKCKQIPEPRIQIFNKNCILSKIYHNFLISYFIVFYFKSQILNSTQQNRKDPGSRKRDSHPDYGQSTSEVYKEN